MYVLIVQIDIPAAHREAYLTEAAAHARRCLEGEPGTLRFDIIQDEGDENRIYLYEGYTDRAAFDAHGQGESMAQFRAGTKDLSASAQILGRGTVR